MDWREGSTGRVLRRVQMRTNAGAMLLADYRSVGAPDLVCVSDKGEGDLMFLRLLAVRSFVKRHDTRELFVVEVVSSIPAKSCIRFMTWTSYCRSCRQWRS